MCPAARTLPMHCIFVSAAIKQLYVWKLLARAAVHTWGRVPAWQLRSCTVHLSLVVQHVLLHLIAVGSVLAHRLRAVFL